jgi:hypothetical protein
MFMVAGPESLDLLWSRGPEPHDMPGSRVVPLDGAVASGSASGITACRRVGFARFSELVRSLSPLR